MVGHWVTPNSGGDGMEQLLHRRGLTTAPYSFFLFSTRLFAGKWNLVPTQVDER
jgi:hypothetical protein